MVHILFENKEHLISRRNCKIYNFINEITCLRNANFGEIDDFIKSYVDSRRFEIDDLNNLEHRENEVDGDNTIDDIEIVDEKGHYSFDINIIIKIFNIDLKK
ncbi:hypothetical protein MHBO_001214 [Bonamia ostreae]|uniref:Uncharacterized protein n=1 Tax=Bonamia ostreae TaxID=126728 RepID=A0ABV2AI62_9EUKA